MPLCVLAGTAREICVSCLFTRALGLGGSEVYVVVEIEYLFSFFS